MNVPTFSDGLDPVSTWEKIRRILSVIGAIIAAITGAVAVNMHAQDRQERTAAIKAAMQGKCTCP